MKCLVILLTITLLSYGSVFAQDVPKNKVENKEINPCIAPKEKVSKTLKENTDFKGIPEGFRSSSDPISWIFSGSISSNSDRTYKDVNQPPVIKKVSLSKKKIIFASTDEKSHFINVEVTATDPENDVLTYSYTVSVGRIIGQGAKVKWALCGAKPGIYPITVVIDDGCGVCAEPKTETVEVLSKPKRKK